MSSPRLALFRRREFRLLGSAVFVNSLGNMGETVVLGWLTLELTNSPFLVGVAMGARSLPLFFVGVPAGVLADRFPRRRLLMLTGTGQALTTATLGILTLLGQVSLTSIVLLSTAAGVIRGLEHAARQSYTHDIVGDAHLLNGFAVLGVGMRTGWLLGSLVTGATIANFGSGAAYLVVAAAYLGGAVVLIRAPARARTPLTASGSIGGSVFELLTAVRKDRMLLTLMVLTASAEMLGFSHQALLPSLARDVLHVGPEGLGALNAARSAGGVLGLLLASARRSTAHASFFLAVLVSFGASLIVLGVAPMVVGFTGVALVLLVVNAIGALSDLLSQSMMQLSVPPHLRGRAGGAWVVAIGLAPLGQLQIGGLASLFGVSIALGSSGLALVVLAGVAALLLPRMRLRRSPPGERSV